MAGGLSPGNRVAGDAPMTGVLDGVLESYVLVVAGAGAATTWWVEGGVR